MVGSSIISKSALMWQQPYHRDWLMNSWIVTESSSKSMMWNGLVGGALIAAYVPVALLGLLVGVPALGVMRLLMPTQSGEGKGRYEDEVWRHRLNSAATRMSSMSSTSLKESLSEYTDDELKLAAILELGDLPYEVWTDFLDDEAFAATVDPPGILDHIRAYARLHGTALYSPAVRAEAVRMATHCYRIRANSASRI
jgi:hypothetical protein